MAWCIHFDTQCLIPSNRYVLPSVSPTAQKYPSTTISLSQNTQKAVLTPFPSRRAFQQSAYAIVHNVRHAYPFFGALVQRERGRATLVLTEENRAKLSGLAASRTAPAREVERAAVLLKYAAGLLITEIQRQLGVIRPMIYRCICHRRPEGGANLTM